MLIILPIYFANNFRFQSFGKFSRLVINTYCCVDVISNHLVHPIGGTTFYDIAKKTERGLNDIGELGATRGRVDFFTHYDTMLMGFSPEITRAMFSQTPRCARRNMPSVAPPICGENTMRRDASFGRLSSMWSADTGSG